MIQSAFLSSVHVILFENVHSESDLFSSLCVHLNGQHFLIQKEHVAWVVAIVAQLMMPSRLLIKSTCIPLLVIMMVQLFVICIHKGQAVSVASLPFHHRNCSVGQLIERVHSPSSVGNTLVPNDKTLVINCNKPRVRIITLRVEQQQIPRVVIDRLIVHTEVGFQGLNGRRFCSELERVLGARKQALSLCASQNGVVIDEVRAKAINGDVVRVTSFACGPR
mmetsp:Transcript_20247/g.40533  ORF Transcript_20247/g.40533 Transcript_20247/m.40533 type:complete len:221 (-) Transcript_20247:418-1080(-)